MPAYPSGAHTRSRRFGRWLIRLAVTWATHPLANTSRAFTTVESYLTDERLPVQVSSAAEYYVIAGRTNPADVAERGRQAGVALGEDPARTVAGHASRVLELVRSRPFDVRLTTAAGTMTLVEYLPTRTFELVVHTCDLAAALGRVPDVPAAAARSATMLAAALAVEKNSAGTLLLAVTGRRSLPAGFTLL